MERTDLSTALSQSALLGSLSAEELRALAARSVRRQYGAGELLFSEGESCMGMYIVSQGRVRIFKTSVNGREQVLSVEGAGGTVAELPVFDGGAYPASVVALEDTEIVFISRRDFQACCVEHPEVALKVLAVVGARLRRLVGIIEELSFTTIRQRVASLLVKLAQTEGTKTAHGIEFRLPSSHQEIANQLGTVRELISRNLTRMQAEGLIEVDAREVVVKDLAGLSALLDNAG
ncbi:MAG: Crp/Fnr family transcriptional regulator [Terracidiphilus sp.]|nr:Crp/Fnr family transcriptional regulator [Terracidiphilus sp.]